MPPSFPPSIQRVVLKILSRTFVVSCTGLSPFIASLSREVLVTTKAVRKVLQPHISSTLLQRIQFAFCCFQSPLLTASLLISFPSGTKTFQFPELPNLTVSKEKSHSDILGSIPTCGSPRLSAACHILHRRPEPSLPPHRLI